MKTKTLKQVLIGFFIALIFLQGLVTDTFAENQEDDKVTLYFFWGEGCPHCIAQKPFLEELQDRYPSIEVKEFEVYNDKENSELFTEVAEAYGFKPQGVPTTFVGDDYFAGYSKSIGEKIEDVSSIENPHSIEEIDKAI